MQRELHHPSDSDEWATPPSLLRPLDEAVGGFNLDAANGAESLASPEIEASAPAMAWPGVKRETTRREPAPSLQITLPPD